MSVPNPDVVPARLTVRAPIAPMMGEPRISAPLVSQLLAGEVVDVLESRGDWRRVRGSDGYEGWAHIGYLTATAGDESSWRVSLGVTVRDAAGAISQLPLGARVSADCEVVAGEALSREEAAARFPAEPGSVASTATELFRGASYMWAGVTPWGCDCSGLVQRAFALHGIMLPRDAWQQATQGTALETDASAAHPAGALLFFTDREDRRVTHVGIALGDGRMVHSSLSRGGVAVETMTGNDPYVERLRAGCTGVQRVP